jgi:hypothetical protein
MKNLKLRCIVFFPIDFFFKFKNVMIVMIFYLFSNSHWISKLLPRVLPITCLRISIGWFTNIFDQKHKYIYIYIYDLIIIIVAWILASVRCELFKISKVSHLNMLLHLYLFW